MNSATVYLERATRKHDLLYHVGPAAVGAQPQSGGLNNVFGRKPFARKLFRQQMRRNKICK